MTELCQRSSELHINHKEFMFSEKTSDWDIQKTGFFLSCPNILASKKREKENLINLVLKDIIHKNYDGRL